MYTNGLVPSMIELSSCVMKNLLSDWSFIVLGVHDEFTQFVIELFESSNDHNLLKGILYLLK